jgi:hypothetical protein
MTSLRYRAAAPVSRESRERYDEADRLEKALRKTMAEHRYLSQAIVDLSDRLGPAAGERCLRVVDVLAASPVPERAAVVTDVASVPPAAGRAEVHPDSGAVTSGGAGPGAPN